MPTMINLGKEMLRICPKDNKKLEYSTNRGATWILRYAGSPNAGNFQDIMDAGKELLATTSNGLFFSTNNGHTWSLRRRN